MAGNSKTYIIDLGTGSLCLMCMKGRVRPICRYVLVSADKGSCHIGTLSVSADKILHIGRFADQHKRMYIQNYIRERDLFPALFPALFSLF